MNQLR